MATNEELQRQLEEAQERINSLDGAFNDLLSRTSQFNSISSDGLEKILDKAGISKDKVESLSKTFEQLKKSANSFDFSNLINSIKNLNSESLGLSNLKKSAEDAADKIIDALGLVQESAGNVGSVASSMAAIGFSKLKEHAVEKVSGIGKELGVSYNDIQKRLMDVQKTAQQSGIALGQSFVDANQSTGMFNQTLADTMGLTNEMYDVVLQVRGSLAEAFAPDEMIRSLKGLNEASKLTAAAMNLTNVSMLTSAATGMDNSEIVKIMTETHLDLGTSLEETAKIFGTIREAAKDSGLQYGKVANSIHDARKSLRFFGSTVEAISPIFKTFSNSLKGVGKEGLTPDLLRDFVGGLEKMDLGTRALLSISAPGMQGGGLLGGGLRMERALETGEGMGDIAKSITETMKRFGGQRILTREEAIDSPGAERNYIIQRQILGKLTGIQGAGKQNEMMRILQDMDKHGLDSAGDSEKALGELMAAGEKVQEATTTDLKKAQVDTTKMIQTQGEKMVLAINNLARGFGIQTFLKKISSLEEKLAVSGDISIEEIKNILKSLTMDKNDILNTLENTDLTTADTGTKESIMQKLTDVEKKTQASNISIALSRQITKEIGSAMRGKKWTAGMEREYERYGKTGAFGKKAMEIVRADFEEKRGRVERELSSGGLKEKEEIAKKAELAGIVSALKDLKNFGKKDTMTGQELINNIKERERLVEETRNKIRKASPNLDIPSADVDVERLAQKQKKQEITTYASGRATADGAGEEKIITIKLEFPEEFKEWNKGFIIDTMGGTVSTDGGKR